MLPSYRAVLRDLNLIDRHETGQYQNNLCENSHLHFRRQERAMCGFRSMENLQKSMAICAAIFNQFCHQRHFPKRNHFKDFRSQSLADWRHICFG